MAGERTSCIRPLADAGPADVMLDEPLAPMIPNLVSLGRQQLADPIQAIPKTVPTEACSLPCIARYQAGSEALAPARSAP